MYLNYLTFTVGRDDFGVSVCVCAVELSSCFFPMISQGMSFKLYLKCKRFGESFIVNVCMFCIRSYITWALLMPPLLNHCKSTSQ